MDDTVTKLEAEFCPPLDTAVFYAIVSDYELSNEQGLSALREILETLKASATEEENSGFDPTGTSTQVAAGSTAVEGSESGYTASNAETGTFTSHSTDSSGLSTGLRSLGLQSESSSSGGDFGSHVEYRRELDKLDDATKTEFLRAVFPGASEYSIVHTLKSCKGDVERASEELMNHVFFNEEDVDSGEDRVLAKGIDAFSEDHIVRRGRKKQSKKKGRLSQADPEERRASSLPNQPDTPKANAWSTSSTGYTTPTSQQKGGIEIIPYYVSPNLPSNKTAPNDPSWTQVRPRSKPTTRTTSPSRLPQTPSSDPFALASLYSQFQRNAMSQAAAARQRGKSQPLMAAAAGHYSQVSREFAMKSKAARQEAASAFVAGQSSRNEIDLHYVTVEDAKRIAKAKTEEWWNGQGRRVRGLDGRWMEEGGGSGGVLRIVTGMGNHSEGGKARIKPAVEAVLKSEGWDFDSREGVISVMGRRR